jgi:hypothetical protein
MEGTSTWNRSLLRKLMWCAAGGVLLLPAIAMRVGVDGVVWTARDFATMGVMLALAGGAFEIFARMSGGVFYRLGAAAAVGGAFLLVWVNLAVGFIGTEGNPANLMFAGVLLVEIIGAIVVRARASGMAFTMLATACVQALIGGYALVARLGEAWEIAMGTGLFVAIWLASAALFRVASRGAEHG